MTSDCRCERACRRCGRGGADVVERLFRPLGYTLSFHPSPHRPITPSPSDVLSFEISGEQTVHDLLSHLYVLLPVLDAAKHYFVGADEVDKLLAHGEGWLAHHPEKQLITNRYLKHRRGLVREALSQLTAGQDEEDAEAQETEEVLEQVVGLHEQRIAAVVAALQGADPPLRRIVDMGCGEGRLLQALLADRAFTELVGVDVSSGMLTIAEKRLALERRTGDGGRRTEVKLLQGSLLYRDRRLEGYDALALVEVLEHIAAERLDTVQTVLFRHLRPRRVVITTPNVAYNARFAALAPGQMRHADHRFEWTPDQFHAWSEGAAAHGYTVRFSGVGPSDPEVGEPTQMAVFDRDGQHGAGGRAG